MQGASLKRLVESHGPLGFYRKMTELLDAEQISVDDFSYRELAEACGVLGNLRRNHASMLAEASPGASTALFPVMTTELLSRKVIEGYETDDGWIADRLVTVVPSRLRNQKLAGLTGLAGPLEVAEGHDYQDSTFDEKYVTTEELKKGRILSINEELIEFDQTGEINRRAVGFGYWARQERERFIVRQVQDVDGTVYRPSGTAENLYATDGSNLNYIGVGNTVQGAPFAAASALADYTDIDLVRRYRATKIKDDRVDGSQLPFMVPMRQLLVPESIATTAETIVGATEIRATNGANETAFKNPFRSLQVLSSPFVDEVDVNNYYAGNFPRQFVWTEIWPIQTFMQRGDSEARFERDVVLRVKVRYYGGIAATDTIHVTKIDGA